MGLCFGVYGLGLTVLGFEGFLVLRILMGKFEARRGSYTIR